MSGSKWTFSSRNKLLLALVCAAFVGEALAQLPPKPVIRKWTLADGQSLDAAVVSFDGDTAELKPTAGAVVRKTRAELSEEDGIFLDDWAARQPLKLPDTVAVDGYKLPVEVVQEEDKTGVYIYRTPNFEFTCEGRLVPSLLRDVARNFEATRELVKALPWGIEPRPENGDRFKALLVRNFKRYKEEGAPDGSGGVYVWKRKMFIMPFESLGIRPQGTSFMRDANYSSDTLVHELTHQMMHASLALLPQWVIEGTAEYTNAIPLRNGMFRVSAAKTGLREVIANYQRRGGVPESYPLDQIFWISNEDWNRTLTVDRAAAHRLYFTSFLLVYYFMHLDGDGNAVQFRRYMSAIGRQRRVVDDYLAQVEEFKKQPGVETLPDGSYRWRGNLKAPAEPAILSSPEIREQHARETLGILLNGRTSEELMKQIRSAYRGLGIRL